MMDEAAAPAVRMACAVHWLDRAFGNRGNRPAGGPLFAKVKKGDVVIVPKLDRLFRSALEIGRAHV